MLRLMLRAIIAILSVFVCSVALETSAVAVDTPLSREEVDNVRGIFATVSEAFGGPLNTAMLLLPLALLLLLGIGSLWEKGGKAARAAFCALRRRNG